MLFSELKCKDVINMRDCKKLGRISDLEFDQCSGQICKVFSRISVSPIEILSKSVRISLS